MIMTMDSNDHDDHDNPHSQARRHNATVNPVLLHDWSSHWLAKCWGDHSDQCDPCFFVIIVIIVIFNIIINMRCIFTQGLMRSFEQQNASVHEILYYHKNSTGIWLEVNHPYHGVVDCDYDSYHCLALNVHGHGKKSCVIIFRLNWFRSRTRPIL